MVDLNYFGNLALSLWLNLNPSPHWANQMIEHHRGLPFGTYLHASRPARQRALTGPLDRSGDSIWHRMQIYSSLETEQHTGEQAQCGFLSKLPIDIRMIIYEMVLGGMVLHLSTVDAKGPMGHYICPDPNQVDHLGQHFCSVRNVPSSWPPEPKMDTCATGLLPLLVTCRRIYSEAISTLYSANTFEFTQNSAAFVFLKSMIPPQRLPCFRHFRLNLRIPRHPALNPRTTRDWNDLWKFFGEDMSGLQSLQLKLQMLQPVEAAIETTKDDEAENWMRPMMLMALKSHAQRGCKVVVVTRHVKHEPAQIFQRIRREHPGCTYEDTLLLACAELHARIRVSFGSRG